MGERERSQESLSHIGSSLLFLAFKSIWRPKLRRVKPTALASHRPPVDVEGLWQVDVKVRSLRMRSQPRAKRQLNRLSVCVLVYVCVRCVYEQ